jgi:hypothetical protein
MKISSAPLNNPWVGGLLEEAASLKTSKTRFLDFIYAKKSI